jgi:hypothetical protein
LNPIFHTFTFLVVHLLPVCIIISYDRKVKGITELRVLIRFSEVWCTLFVFIKYIIRHILGEK